MDLTTDPRLGLYAAATDQRWESYGDTRLIV